jgi:hypothetical protein
VGEGRVGVAAVECFYPGCTCADVSGVHGADRVVEGDAQPAVPACWRVVPEEFLSGDVVCADVAAEFEVGGDHGWECAV